MNFSAFRLLAIGGATAALLAAGGLAAEAWRFGLSGDAAAVRLERDVRQRFDRRARDVDSLAQRVARDTAPAVTAAAESPDDVPALFDRLNGLAPITNGELTAATVTIYIRQPEGQYRILAWSDGPAESVSSDLLRGAAALAVVPGTLGLRLVSVQPIVVAGQRIAVAAAETVLAPTPGIGRSTGAYPFETSFGIVTLTFPPAAVATGHANGFTIATAPNSGFDVQVSARDLATARRTFRRRALALAALPIAGVALLLTGALVRRRHGARTAPAFGGWSLAAAALVAAASALLIWLAHLIGAPASVVMAIQGMTAVFVAALVPVALWWRGARPLRPARVALLFLVEQLTAGVLLTGCLWAVATLLRIRITSAALTQWQRPLFPIHADGLAYLTGLFLIELALCWTAAAGLALMVRRWRLRLRSWSTLATAVSLWLLPAVITFTMLRHNASFPDVEWLPGLVLVAAFALASGWLRRRYRQRAQATRLMLLYAALIAPVLALYPVAWFYADSAGRTVIASDYAPKIAGRPKDTLDVLTLVRSEIDRIPFARVTDFLAPIPGDRAGVPTLPAFFVWSQTSLATTRLTAAIELSQTDGTLVSRFALNMPEYQGGDPVARTAPTSCDWRVFGEAVPFGAEERDMLHARRLICDASGQPRGAVLVHVVNDYQALPFVATPDPYREVLGSPDSRPGPMLADLQVVVYGWSFTPTFTSGNIAWPITAELSERLYRSRAPFWTKRVADGRTYDVHFSNDRRFIYAIGYPSSTLFEHLTRLAEAAALMAALFVVWLLGAAVYAPLARPRTAPLRDLFKEIRESFYRKLFLLFVVAAVGPVLIFTLAFGIYMTAKFRADVATEAASVVTVARRVLEQASAIEPQPGPFNDDVMLWVGQVLHQDVNLFEGPELLATSQRDLYESGLLPTRTPAKVYRAIALGRLPSFVAEEWLGPFSYVVAGAPMPAAGRNFVLSVPLASRQREIEREIDELNRGVLVGAVFVVLFAAGLGASVAGKVSDPVKRLSKAARLIAQDKLDIKLIAQGTDELSRLVADFNSMAATLKANRTALAKANQLEAWAEMARQVAHEIKNPLTPIQLAAEHLESVHADQGRPLGAPFDQCVGTILRQVRLLRQIASEFSNFAGQPAPKHTAVSLHALVEDVVAPYRVGLHAKTALEVDVSPALASVWADRTLIARALTNLVENALQAMPAGGTLSVSATEDETTVTLSIVDTGVGMDAEAAARAFEPYFSTKTGGSGLGLANARRNIETCGGSIELTSAPGGGTSVRVTLGRSDRRPGPATGSTPSR